MKRNGRAAYGTGRDLLIEAAIRVVASKGLRGLTYRAVGDEAGVNNTLVAHHFGSRDALLAAALDGVTQDAIESTRLILFSTSEEEFIEALLNTTRSTPELHAFQYEMILEARRNPAFRPAVQKLYADYIDAMRDGLTAFGITENIDSIARVTFASLDGLVMQYIAGVDEESIRDAIRAVWNELSALAGQPNRS